MKNLITLLGPPGSGKSTLINFMKEDGMSTYTFHTALAAYQESHPSIKKQMEQGIFVPDETVFDIFWETFKPEGDYIVLDGIPRNLPQYEALIPELKKRGYTMSFMILGGNEKVFRSRIVNRWYSPITHEVYNTLTNPTPSGQLKDSKGNPLIQRRDDTDEIYTKRLKEYAKHTQPLAEYIKENEQRVYYIDAAKSISDIKKQYEQLNIKKFYSSD